MAAMTARLSLLAQYEIIGFGVPTTSLAAVPRWRLLSTLADHLHEHQCSAPTSDDAVRYACVSGVDLEEFLDFVFSGTADYHAPGIPQVRTSDGGWCENSLIPAIIEVSGRLRIR